MLNAAQSETMTIIMTFDRHDLVALNENILLPIGTCNDCDILTDFSHDFMRNSILYDIGVLHN